MVSIIYTLTLKTWPLCYRISFHSSIIKFIVALRMSENILRGTFAKQVIHCLQKVTKSILNEGYFEIVCHPNYSNQQYLKFKWYAKSVIKSNTRKVIPVMAGTILD